jgi:hypothetical protein
MTQIIFTTEDTEFTESKAIAICILQFLSSSVTSVSSVVNPPR